jgi:hypothetical protein
MTHIDYHVVLETLRDRSDQCPLCSFIERGEKSYFESMLYSWVGTEGFQDRFLAADGFCPAHAHRLSDRNDGVAVAMLYGPLLKHRQSWLEHERYGRLRRFIHRLRTARDRKPTARGERAHPDACPLCEQVKTWEESFLRNLSRHEREEDLRTAFRAGYGLCLPHYRLFARLTRVPTWIESHQRNRMDDLLTRLEDFTNARAGGVGGRASTPWRDLLHFMEGAPGTFRRPRSRGRLRW